MDRGVLGRVGPNGAPGARGPQVCFWLIVALGHLSQRTTGPSLLVTFCWQGPAGREGPRGVAGRDGPVGRMGGTGYPG